MTATFTPPTHEAWTFSEGVNLDPSEKRFWAHYGGQLRGKSVIKLAGVYTLVVTPTSAQIEAADTRIDPVSGERVPAVFMGGHEYVVSDGEADALEDAGYTVDPYGGYAGGYGQGY